MTVERVANDHVSCSWFAGEELRRESFLAAMLKRKEAQVAMRVLRRNALRTDYDPFGAY